MTQPAFHVVGIGNAIVDILAHTDDAFLEQQSLDKGAMTLIDADQAAALYDLMEVALAASGGSAANTLAGLASLGGRGAFIGKLHDRHIGLSELRTKLSFALRPDQYTRRQLTW